MNNQAQQAQEERAPYCECCGCRRTSERVWLGAMFYLDACRDCVEDLERQNLKDVPRGTSEGK